jgi:hypothetical protein
MKNSRVPIVKAWFAAHYPTWLKHRIKGKGIEEWKRKRRSNREKKTDPSSRQRRRKKPKLQKTQRSSVADIWS